MKTASKVEFGDFQTPESLADEVCQLLLRLGEAPDTIIEPTAGAGAFLVAASKAFPTAELRGFEINPEYVLRAQSRLAAINEPARASVVCRDFFSHDWDEEVAGPEGRLLLLGNPPWVTNAGVSAVGGTNVPVKENMQDLKGIAALTGKANFDISEWMLIRLLRALHGRTASLAMLCKTSTARKFLRYAWKNHDQVSRASLYRINAMAHFGAAVDACLLYFHTGSPGPEEANVYLSLSDTSPASSIGLSGNELVADLRGYRALAHLEGSTPFRWRSGVKHDCSAVMEFDLNPDGSPKNGFGDRLTIEATYRYPLLKCSDLANGRIMPSREVLITQRFVGDDTSAIAKEAPLTWTYLERYRERFENRKSSIYRGRVAFCLFGIGEYAFAPWKVAISGLHRSLRFQLVGPHRGRPVFFDDTCYYLPFENEHSARVVFEILSSEVCIRFLATLFFPDSKRPVTVDLLQRLDLAAIADEAGLSARWAELRSIYYSIGGSAPQMELLMEGRARQP